MLVGKRRTSGERALPCSQVLRNLRHFHIRVELVDFVQHSVFVVVTEVIICLLRIHIEPEPVKHDALGHTFGFGAELTMAFSWPKVIESRPSCCPFC